MFASVLVTCPTMLVKLKHQREEKEKERKTFKDTYNGYAESHRTYKALTSKLDEIKAVIKNLKENATKGELEGLFRWELRLYRSGNDGLTRKLHTSLSILQNFQRLTLTLSRHSLGTRRHYGVTLNRHSFCLKPLNQKIHREMKTVLTKMHRSQQTRYRARI